MASTTQSLPAYMDVSRTCPLLCVLGGHDLGLTVAAIAQCAGFQVVVIDDRGGRDEQSTFIDSGKLLVKDYDEVISEMAFDGNTYVMIDLGDHMCGKSLLQALLREDTAYLGLAGDAEKIERIFSHLKIDGFSEWDLGRIHYPMGLSIGGKSVGERAVGIVAQLIDVRSRRDTPLAVQDGNGSDTIPWDVLLSWCR